MLTNAWGWLPAAVLGFTLACTETPALQYPQTPVVSRRVAAWPSDVLGRKDADPERIAKTRQNLDESITYRVHRHGGRSFEAASVEGLEHSRAFRRWTSESLRQIVAELQGSSRSHHANVGDYRFSHNLDSWRAPLDADFVLVTLVLDGPGSGVSPVLAAGALGGALGGLLAYSMAQQTRRVISCVVHLRDSRIVWCNFDASALNDLTVRSGAQQEVDGLLDEMLRNGDTAPREAPPPVTTTPRIAAAADVPPPPAPPPTNGETPVPLRFQARPPSKNSGPP